MKRIQSFILCLLCFSFNTYAQDYYWYKGKQIHLHQGNQLYIIYEEDQSKNGETMQIIEGGDITFQENKTLKWAIVNQKSPLDVKSIVYQTPSFLCFDSTQNMFVTHCFYVKLKKSSDIELLQSYAERYHTEIIQDSDSPLWYIVKCTMNSQYNALKLANIFYESGLFAAAEPEFSHAIRMDCVTDPYFSEQWNLKNTGQYGSAYSGIDINYCAAHAITSGSSSIIIGVFDIGVELTHPDLNLYSFSYDVNTESSPSTIYTTGNGNNYHGTACAGIIGAKTDNSVGVAGIAPQCPIMSLSFYNTTSYRLKKGFVTAANNGCSVISNSWNCAAPSDYIDEGISYALTHGRNGKGCVVVFSAGNENRDSINYPANSNDSIIVVGAMSPCGERCNPNSCDWENWGSNYGARLDIMAPGVKIYTTDRVGNVGDTENDYTGNFSGTSSACPHVAAVAGLILSVNPYLSQKEVVDIIESTAQKIGSGYNPAPNRPNGTWNMYWGYGLVDAYEAVLEAQNRYPIQGPDYVCDTAKYYLAQTPPSGSTITWSVHNGEIQYPHYTIINTPYPDTVLVSCEYVTPMRGTERDMVDDGKWIKAVIRNGSDSVVYKKDLRMPTGEIPTVVASSSSTWYFTQSRTFSITNCLSVPDNALKWTVKKTLTDIFNQSTTTTFYSGRVLTYSTNLMPGLTCEVTITATNPLKECGDNSVSNTYQIIYNPLFLATITNDILNITIGEESESEDPQKAKQFIGDLNDYTLELWHTIYGCMRVQDVKNIKEQMNIADLPKGVYVLILKEKGTIISQNKIVIP